MAVTAVIAAAGSGERLGADGPKAFVPLAGRSMIEWSIDAFRACDPVAAIVVAVPPEMVEDGNFKAGEGEPGLESREQAVGPAIEVLAGGATRAESVANAIAAVDTELVAIHDAARPLLTPELVIELVAVLESDPQAAGAIAAAPITDTVKRAVQAPGRSSPAFPSIETGKVGLAIETTLDRSTLWGAQTPQIFRTELLREAIAVAPGHLDPATDEAMLIEGRGGTVLIHPSGPGNLKVTTPLDLKVAELLLAERPGPGAPD
ncbi:MAG TPA: 2-C-methyl-D-erythritol 4-phosphate cytidylyltransferase [Solirubrobacterales bacterium]|nr:2-C-methyl-D-erythritol 4-phosphate cytidylyltransferase [Solirubrobacterales bacterium]